MSSELEITGRLQEMILPIAKELESCDIADRYFDMCILL